MDKERRTLIVATMSSGKSTLVNALLGENILLSKNEACTANSYYIKNNSKCKSKLLIRCLGETNRVVLDETSISMKDKVAIKKHMDIINSNENISNIEILGSFKQIKKLSLIDTPGANNSLDENHMKKTIETIKKGDYDNIVYVINATQLGVTDDKDLLECVKRYTTTNLNEIIFVVNKIDELDIEQDESLNDIYENCKKYLKSCEFENPKIFMTSAYMAGLIQKKHKKETLTKKEERNLKSMIELLGDSKFNLDDFNKGEYTENKSIFKSITQRKLKGTGIVELRNYLTREEK